MEQVHVVFLKNSNGWEMKGLYKDKTKAYALEDLIRLKDKKGNEDYSSTRINSPWTDLEVK